MATPVFLSEKSHYKGIWVHYSPKGHKQSDMPEHTHDNCILFRASLVAQMVKNLPVKQETWVQSLGWKDLLEKGMVTHSTVHP